MDSNGTGRKKTYTIRIVQWTCLSFAARIAKLKFRFERDRNPNILLLQETRQLDLKLPGFAFYTCPTTETKPHPAEKNSVVIKGWTAVGVEGNIRKPN